MRGVANQVLMLLAYENNYKWGSKMIVGSMPRAESACSPRVSRFSAFPPVSKYESVRISQMFCSNDLHKWRIVGEENVQRFDNDSWFSVSGKVTTDLRFAGKDKPPSFLWISFGNYFRSLASAECFGPIDCL